MVRYTLHTYIHKLHYTTHYNTTHTTHYNTTHIHTTHIHTTTLYIYTHTHSNGRLVLLQAFELATGDYLFEPHSGEDYTRDEGTALYSVCSIHAV